MKLNRGGRIDRIKRKVDSKGNNRKQEGDKLSAEFRRKGWGS